MSETTVTQAKPKRESRPQRWARHCDEALAAIEALNVTDVEAALDDLRNLKEEYESWKDNLPDNLQSGSLAEKLEAVCDLEFDIDELQSAIDAIREKIEEAQAIDLPRGFGKD